MGIDYYSCEKCGDAFPDVIDYVQCEGCGSMWCSSECADQDEHEQTYDEEQDYYEDSCSYCKNTNLPDDELIEGMLKLLKMDRTEAVQKVLNLRDDDD